MKIEEFRLERFQSLYEHQVDINLSESGVHPLKLSEFVSQERFDDLYNLEIGYAQTNGPIELRQRIADMHHGATVDNVLVTNGAIEANFLAAWSLLEKDDELVYMLPNYVQIKGLANSFGVKIKAFHLKQELDWQPDIDEIKKLISPKTKMIALCNPNNPTGQVLTPEMMAEIVELAKSVDAYLLIDEIYRGTEHNGELSPSFYGSYNKVIVTGSLSKAYGLPGLRIGWIIGPKGIIENAWSYKDYSSITASTISYYLAEIALRPSILKKILGRNRKHVVDNLALLQDWIESSDGRFSLTPPTAGAMAFVRYDLPIKSTDLVDKIHKEQSVLIVPGEYFGMENFLRIGYGVPKEKLKEALSRIDAVVSEL